MPKPNIENQPSMRLNFDIFGTRSQIITKILDDFHQILVDFFQIFIDFFFQILVKIFKHRDLLKGRFSSQAVFSDVKSSIHHLQPLSPTGP